MRFFSAFMMVCAMAFARCATDPKADLGEFVGHIGHGQPTNIAGVTTTGGHYYRNSAGRCQFCPFKVLPECSDVASAHPHPLEEQCLV